MIFKEKKILLKGRSSSDDIHRQILPLASKPNVKTLISFRGDIPSIVKSAAIKITFLTSGWPEFNFVVATLKAHAKYGRCLILHAKQGVNWILNVEHSRLIILIIIRIHSFYGEAAVFKVVVVPLGWKEMSYFACQIAQVSWPAAVASCQHRLLKRQHTRGGEEEAARHFLKSWLLQNNLGQFSLLV